MRIIRFLAVLGVLTLAVANVGPVAAHDPTSESGKTYHQRFVEDRQPTSSRPSNTGALVPCTNGQAAGYPCKNVDLLSHLALADIGGGQGNDIWGWTDPSTSREYAIMGRTNGTSFVDITDPVNPRYLGDLPTATASSPWRDMKVHANHAFIVAEAGRHGMQVFDLTRLRDITTPRTWTADARYTQFGNAHNIAINEDSGYAYAVGTATCGGGLHMVDIRVPKSPRNAGCVSGDGYTHDTQCVIYRGPDTTYTGREICVSSNEDTVTIVDVTTKSNPRQISRTSYAGAAYTHQGWLSEDHRYFLLDDELDEQAFGHGTRTYTFDMADLDAPRANGTHTSTSKAIDHNLYIRGIFAYQANYQAGLRVLSVAGIANGRLTEQGYFDVHPDGDAAEFNGAWSNYPYFPSGTVVVSSIEGGLFVLRHNAAGPK